jgi:hypothetical protein
MGLFYVLCANDIYIFVLCSTEYMYYFIHLIVHVSFKTHYIYIYIMYMSLIALCSKYVIRIYTANGEVAGDWRRMLNEELHNLYAS